MEHIWSPWRMNYIMSHEHKDGCIFCDALQSPDNPENLIVYRGEKSFVILNRYPYTNGHLMVVPIAHIPSIELLEQETCIELMQLITTSIKVLRSVYTPEGFNVGTNIGDVAGAGVASHVHFHIVPRWAGDTNFMTTTGMVRVLPEELCQTYERIVKAWNS
ncbi:MAG: HIT domain-containing protein [Leptolinea sp.]|nr:HIT domain-containing protein [Leptolinea sp.]